jgi:chemotaxis protein methyltransferase CheR
MGMTPLEVEDLELPLLLEAVERRHGVDLRGYARAGLRRRLRSFMREERARTLSGLQEKLLHDGGAMERFQLALARGPGDLFQDPSFFSALRLQVFPLLETYPYMRIWHAGCGTGEDVYSLAILLEEAGIYDRCRIYATDSSELALQRAKAGVFSILAVSQGESGYLEAGGKHALADYYHDSANASNVSFRGSLARNVVFAPHNLVSDRCFNEFNLILCRDVMLSFGRALQKRVHSLIHQSLVVFGVLGLGRGESLRCVPEGVYYEELSSEKLYRRVR